MKKAFEKTLGVPPIPEGLEAVCLAAMEEYERAGVFFLEEAYLHRLQEKCNPFPRTEGEVFAAAARLRADGDAARYALFVCRAMERREAFLANLSQIDFPVKLHPFMAFLCFLPQIEVLFDFLCAKGLPDDVIARTVEQFEECMFVFKERFDHLGMNKRYFDHMQGYVDHKFLNVGRLRFEIGKNKRVFLLENKKSGKRLLFLKDVPMNAAGLHRSAPPLTEGGFDSVFCEDETFFEGTPVMESGRCSAERVRLPKEEYRLILRPGDDLLDVHIPAPGPLTKELCAESYARARALFAAHYPEIAPRAFQCHSWMMAPELAEILPDSSNVLAFQRPYLKYPVYTKGEDVLNFVFKLRFQTYADLPEDTSLQRALKKRYLAGGYLYEYGGIIPFEEETK